MKHYPKEFKVETVKLVTEGGYSAAQVARDMGISTNMLYRSDRGSQYASGDYQKEQESARNRAHYYLYQISHKTYLIQ